MLTSGYARWFLDLRPYLFLFRRDNVPFAKPIGEESFAVQGQSTNPRGGISSNNPLSIDFFDLAQGDEFDHAHIPANVGRFQVVTPGDILSLEPRVHVNDSAIPI